MKLAAHAIFVALRRRSTWIGIGLILLACASAAVVSSRRIRAFAFGSLNLTPWPGDARIVVENGVPPRWPPDVAQSIDRAIARIEDIHGKQFTDRIQICLCATQQSYNWRTGDRVDGIARGAVFAGRVFLSPRCIETDTTEAILTHELSHLHLRQIMDARYVTGVPGWFQEGLAVYASRGGGAEPVTIQAALAAIMQGRCLSPESEGAAIPRGAADHGIGHHMFYRQSGLFVEYLAAVGAHRFREFLVKLQEGEEFETAFADRFGRSPRELWTSYRGFVTRGRTTIERSGSRAVTRAEGG